ncbi:MAG TPA: HAMP domain-containing sensor histidine kinase [Candidatus Binataceae bacterium]|nr:HAMP domain-containing sensor histidine kinase [Candidatus Binataceae bacterium]
MSGSGARLSPTLAGRRRLTLGLIERDLDSLNVLWQGADVAILVTAGYLLIELFGFGYSPRGLVWVWVALGELLIFRAAFWSNTVRRFWRPVSLCFGMALIATFGIFAHLSQRPETLFVSAMLCPLATSAYIAWTPSWQLAMNAASLSLYVLMPMLLGDPKLYIPAHLAALVTALAFAQSSSVYIERYRRRLRQQVRDLEEAAGFRDAQISTMAHDVRSPLAAIAGYATLLQAQDLAPQDRSDLLARLGLAAWNMDLVVSNLLDMYQIEAHGLVTEPREIDLTPNLREVVDSCEVQASRRGVELKTALCELPRCRHDPRHVERIVKNLVGFVLSRVDSGAARLECGPHENQIRIEVCDDGPAISASELAALCTQFPRNGFGSPSRDLNLYIARRLTEASGGIFSAHPGERGGLRLVAELPVHGQAASRTPA